MRKDLVIVPDDEPGMLADLTRFLAATGIRPLIDEVFPMERGREAFERMIDGELFGKLVLVR